MFYLLFYAYNIMDSHSYNSEADVFDTRIDMEIIPIGKLGSKTRHRLCTYLNAKKLLLSETSYQRDWRGLFDLARIPRPYFQTLEASENATKELLLLWMEEGQNANFAMLQRCLIDIDRIDCLDDCKELFEEDAQVFYRKRNNTGGDSDSSQEITEDMICTIDDRRDMELGLPLQQYDALLIYADSEEEDVGFARLLMKELTELRDLKICSNDSILAGNPFEHDAKRTLLTKRCNRLIVILSASFSMSKQDTFLANLAQSIGIENQTRKLIPCAYKKCPVPELFQHMTILNFDRAIKMYNFWDRLYESVKASRVPIIEVTEAAKTTSNLSLLHRESKTNSILSVSSQISIRKGVDERDVFNMQPETPVRMIYPPENPRRNYMLDDLNAPQRSSSLSSLASDVEKQNSSKTKSIKKKISQWLSSKDKKDKKRQNACAVAS